MLNFASLSQLSAFVPRGQPCVFMTLKVYCDGSGKSDDAQCRFLTLAAFSGTEDTMQSFQQGWMDILRTVGVGYLHMADLWQTAGEFKGWDETQREELLNRLIVYMSGYRKWDPSTDLMGLACTVDLEAHRLIESNGERRLKDPESLCVDYCIGHQFNRPPKPSPGYLSLYFDQNESFLHKIYRIWTLKKDGKRAWWADLVKEISTVDMRHVPAVQASDLLAWVANRDRSKTPSDVEHLRLGLILSTAIFAKVYDRDALLSDPHALFKD